MQRSKVRFSTIVFLVILVISACNLNQGVAPSESVQPTPIISNTEVASTIIPIDLAGPTIGTTMPWYDGNTLIFVPAGEFIMGASGVDNPQHTINLSAFWIYRTEVTNRQYQTCISVGQCTAPRDPTSAQGLSGSNQLDMPVTGVDWPQAQAYCKWVQGHLPTEAQWEKTGRGTDGKRFPWGESDPACNLLNFSGCLGSLTKVNEHPDGRSFYGGFDMAGNALEWVQDWYDINYYSISAVQDPAGPDLGVARVTRSSSFLSFPSDLDLARRQYLEPDQFRSDLGFRCVVDEPQMLLPFCQTSAIAQTPSSSEASDSQSQCTHEIEVSSPYCSQKQSYANVLFGSKPDEGITHPGDLDCNYAGLADDGRKIYTCGPGSGSVEVEVCGPCANDAPAQETGCALGYIKDPDGNCVLEFGQSSPGGCPAGWVQTSYGCALFGPGGHPVCPAGGYWDAKVPGCVSNGVPDQGACLPGFIVDPQGCCAIPAGGQYPGCGADAVMDENGFCTPPSGSASESCTPATVTFKSCGGGPSGEIQQPPGGCALICPGGGYPDDTCTTCLKP